MTLHPDFSHPGKQPGGATEVDRSDVFGRELIGLYYDELTVNRFGGPIGTPAGTSPPAKVPRGYQFLIGNGTRIEGLKQHPNLGQVTLFVRWYPDVIANNDHVYTDGWSGAGSAVGNNFRIKGQGTGCRFEVSDGTTIISADATSGVVGEKNDWVGTYDGLTATAYILNAGTSGTAAFASARALNSADNNEASIGNSDNGGAGNWNNFPCEGRIEYIAIFRRAFSEDQLQELSRNPYRVLKPAIETPLIAPAGGIVAQLNAGAISLAGASILGRITAAMAAGGYSLSGGDMAMLRQALLSGGSVSLYGADTTASRVGALGGGSHALAGGDIVGRIEAALASGSIALSGSDLALSIARALFAGNISQADIVSTGLNSLAPVNSGLNSLELVDDGQNEAGSS